MITTKQQSRLIDKIKSMSELELESFFEEVAEYFEKNNLVHIIEDRFYLDQNEGLQAELADMTEERDEMEREKDELEEKNEKAIELLSKLDKDDYEGDIDEIINTLS